ncbi:MAG: hypothetical protein ACOCWG_00805 [bacterium]
MKNLKSYIENENYKGYDPYDTLNSWIPFHWLGKWGPILATQFQKRNPINIRPILGIRKDANPKTFGLFLLAYSLLYKKTKNRDYLDKADYFFKWLKNNYSKGYCGYCWGYNFPWANPKEYKKKYTPSSVVTGFVCKGLSEYINITDNEEAKKVLISASEFILNDIAVKKDNNGVCFSYTPQTQDLCFNASLLAAEVLARAYVYEFNKIKKEKTIQAVNWVIAHQKEDGRWNYSKDIETGKEREQIDFHQGYVLESIFAIKNLLNIQNEKWELALKKGLKFYREKQFFDNGISYWRYPKQWPVEIHNQSQGIITFCNLAEYSHDYIEFAKTIAEWTINNMQVKDGHFYYQKFKYHTHRISYMRWSNAWMFLALVLIYENNQ